MSRHKKSTNSYGKHFESSNKNSHKQNKKNFSKFFLIILLVVILIILIALSIYFIQFKLKQNNKFNFDDTNAENEISDISESAEIEELQKVKGAEYLEITGLTINTDNPKLSTVSAQLKNTSEKLYKNVNLQITLLDANNKKILSIDYKIDNIKPQETAITFSSVKQDLSNCKNYSISLIK